MLVAIPVLIVLLVFLPVDYLVVVLAWLLIGYASERVPSENDAPPSVPRLTVQVRAALAVAAVVATVGWVLLLLLPERREWTDLVGVAVIAASIYWWRRGALEALSDAWRALIRRVPRSNDVLEPPRLELPIALSVGISDEGVWVAGETHVALVGRTGAGKTRSHIAPMVLAQRGPVVAVSTRADVAGYTAAVRGLLGNVFYWDPSGGGDVPFPCIPVRWSPLDLVADEDSAHRVAERLVEAAQLGSTSSSSESYFSWAAQEILAPLLAAAATQGQGMTPVWRWLSGDPTSLDDTDPVAWASAHKMLIASQQIDLAAALRSLIEQARGDGGRRLDSAVATARQVTRVYARKLARDASEKSNLNVAQLVRGADTIFVVASPDEQRACAPIISLFISAVVEERRRFGRSSSGPLLLALDELSAVPLPGLATILGESRYYGVNVVAGLQSFSQLDRWPQAQSLKELFPSMVLYPNCSDVSLLSEIASLTRVLPGGGRVIDGGIGLQESSASLGMDGWHQRQASLPTARDIAGSLRDGQVRLVLGRQAGPILQTRDVDQDPWLQAITVATEYWRQRSSVQSGASS